MEAREKLARERAEQIVHDHEDNLQAYLFAIRSQGHADTVIRAGVVEASREALVLALLGDSHRPVSGSEPEKASASFLDLHGEADKAREINRRLSEEVEAVAGEYLPGSASPHRSEALEIRKAVEDIIMERDSFVEDKAAKIIALFPAAHKGEV